MGRTSDARERLVTSGMMLLHRRSYGSVGVDELCEHAGVKKGSFYHFFASKRDLTLAVLEAQWEAIRDRVLDPAFAVDVSPLERIQRAFELAYRFQLGAEGDGHAIWGCPLGNLAVELGTQDDVVRAKVQEIFDRFAGYFARGLADAASAGELGAAAADAGVVARALLAYLEGLLVLAKTADDPDLIRRLAPTPPLLASLHGLTGGEPRGAGVRAPRDAIAGSLQERPA